MRIAFAADNKKDLDSLLSLHFGRCPYYIFVDVDENKNITAVEETDNPFYQAHQPGQVPQFIKARGADVIIAGGMGPRAADFFSQMGIEPVTVSPRVLREVLQGYLAGELKGFSGCSGRHHQ